MKISPITPKLVFRGEQSYIENSEYQLLLFEPLELIEHDKILPNQTGNTQSAEPMPKSVEKSPNQTSNIQPSERREEAVTDTKPIIVSTTFQGNCDPKTGKWKGICYKKKRKELESSTTPTQGHESDQTPENEVPTGNILPNSEHVDINTTDIDIPIAMRKGVRTCTKHPIEK